MTKDDIATRMYSGHWPEITRMAAMTKLEEMARAAFEVGLMPGTYDHLPEGAKGIMRARMKAALKVLREPSEAMVDAGAKETDMAWDNGQAAGPSLVWQHMLDAVLEEKG